MTLITLVAIFLLQAVTPVPEVAPTTLPVVVSGPVATNQPAGTLGKDSTVAELLVALHQRGLDLTDFEAEVSLGESDASTGAGSIRAGRVYYEVRPGDSGAAVTRLLVQFETRAEDDGPPRAEKLVYLLDNAYLTERNYRRKVEIRRQVLRPGQSINLFRLGEGPFPLPIGQDPADVERQFEVSRLESPDPRPALRLVPREKTRLHNKFSTIDVWIDPVTRFPTRIETVNRQETTVRSTELKNLAVNTKTSRSFELPEVDGEWKRTEEGLED